MVKEIKQAKNNSVEFTKRLSGVCVAISLFTLGIYAIYLGKEKVSLMVCASALVFSGAINLIVGCVVLYRVLMNKEG